MNLFPITDQERLQVLEGRIRGCRQTIADCEFALIGIDSLPDQPGIAEAAAQEQTRKANAETSLKRYLELYAELTKDDEPAAANGARKKAVR